jgi:hypothetical protein
MNYLKLTTIRKYSFIWILAILVYSCEETNSEEATLPIDELIIETDTIKEVIVDSVLLGQWRSIHNSKAFNIDSTGKVVYAKMNYVTGKFEVEQEFQDKVIALDGLFLFQESNNCMTPLDSVYSISNDTLTVSILATSWWREKFVPTNISTFQHKKRPESFVTASIEVQNHTGTINKNLNAHTSYDDIYAYSNFNSSSVIVAFENPNYGCTLSKDFHNNVVLITDGKINGLGTYNLSTSFLTVSMIENNLPYAFVYHPEDFLSGELIVTKYQVLADTILIEGTFDVSFLAPFDGTNYQINVKNGSFKVYEKIE